MSNPAKEGAMKMQRREFLKTAAAGSAALALPGCATMGGGSSGKVVIVGGGYGGATAAKYIRMWSDGKVDVTFVEPNAEFVSCPMSNLVLGGSRDLAFLTVSYDNLARRHGVRIVRDTATGVDAGRRVVKLAGGAELPYDRLILSPGVDFMWDKVPGLNNADAQGKILHAWKAGPQTVALRKQLEAMPDGGVYVIVDPGRAVPVPAGSVRARVPGRVVLQACEAEIESADPRRQRRRHVEGPAVQEGVG